MHHDTTDAQRDEDALRRRGQRLTPQRRMVLSIMRDTHGHVTVDHVMDEVAKLGDQVSLASVYRILGWLADQDLVSITNVGERDLVYEYLGHGRHHHLICRQCGMATDVPSSIFAPVVEEILKQYGFEARMEHQAIFGFCEDCQHSDNHHHEGTK